MNFLRLFPAKASLLLLVLICNYGMGQDSWVAYSQKLNTNAYYGQNFRMSALVRTEIADDSAAAMLWVRVDMPKGVGFFDNMQDRPIRNNQWKKYSLEGKIDSGSSKITFGVICSYNGKFLLDDLKLEVETEKGKWKKVAGADFENNNVSLTKGGSDTASRNKHYQESVTSGEKAQGSKSLLITGVNVPTYGINKKIGKFADVNGIKLYYEIYGQGAPLLVLHGNGGSIENASIFYPDLIKRYKVIAVDSRAQGKSTDTEAPLTYEQMASDINELLEKLQIDSALVWGQSDGAILGLILALDYPEKVKKVLAFGSNVQPDSSAIYQWSIEQDQKVVKETTNPKEKKLNQLMLDHPNIPFSKLREIKAPVLVVAGDRDVIRPEHTLKIFQHIPNSQLCIIPGATHGAAWEKKQLFMTILTDFFDKPFQMPDTRDWY